MKNGKNGNVNFGCRGEGRGASYRVVIKGGPMGTAWRQGRVECWHSSKSNPAPPPPPLILPSFLLLTRKEGTDSKEGTDRLAPTHPPTLCPPDSRDDIDIDRPPGLLSGAAALLGGAGSSRPAFKFPGGAGSPRPFMLRAPRGEPVLFQPRYECTVR